mgnify:FL=1
MMKKTLPTTHWWALNNLSYLSVYILSLTTNLYCLKNQFSPSSKIDTALSNINYGIYIAHWFTTNYLPILSPTFNCFDELLSYVCLSITFNWMCPCKMGGTNT